MPPRSVRPPRRWALLLSFAALATGCGGGKPPSARTLEGAYERVASAIDAGDAKRLYWDLELSARWSLMTIHRDQRRIRALVQADYPVEERARAAGRWTVGSEATGPGELFAVLCARRDCLTPLRDQIGAVSRISRTSTGGTVHTVRGGAYRFIKGNDGRYGLVGFRDELAGLEREVSRDLEVIERTAAQYRRARGGEPSSGEKGT